MTKIVVNFSLDPKTYELWCKIPLNKRSEAVREWLKSKQPEKPEEPQTVKGALFMEDKDYEKLTVKERKNMNAILSSGFYSHRNELGTLGSMNQVGASKKEVRAIRLLYKEGRDRTKQFVDRLLKTGKVIRLESLKSEKYAYQKRFVPLGSEGGGTVYIRNMPSPDKHEEYLRLKGSLGASRRNP